MKELVASLALFVSVFCSACSERTPEGVTTLIYASVYGPNHPFSRADKTWIEFVEARSEGTIRIRPIWSGALLSSDQSMAELRHRVADIGLVSPIYARGGAHLIRVQTGFYAGANTPEDQVRLYHCLSRNNPQFERELDGLKILAVQGGSLPGIITRDRPVKTLEDLKGMRIRAPAELLTILQSLGADPVSMPMADVYSALAKGVLDGVIAPADTFKALHFAEVTSYFTDMKVPRGAYPARAMSVKKWNRLSASERKILEESIEVWEQALAGEVTAADEAGLSIARDEGIAITVPATETRMRFLQIYNEEASRNAASLHRFNIDGTAVLNRARGSIGADGKVNCLGSVS